MIDRFFKCCEYHGKAICLAMVFLLSLPVFGQANTAGKIWYGVDYTGMVIDTSDITSPRFLKEVIKQDNKAKRLLKVDISLYILRFDGENLWFKPIPRMAMDGDNGHLSFYTFVMETVIRDGKIYTPSSFPKEINGKRYFISASKNDLLDGNYDWQLEKKYKTILGHKCQKATEVFRFGKRSWKTEVWFTREIPVSDGPGHFIGLPGMVLAAEYRGRVYYARKIELADKVDLNFPPDDQFVTRDELRKIVEKSKN